MSTSRLMLPTHYKSNDPLRKVVRSEDINTVHRFINELEGIGCSVQKNPGGRRCKIVVSGMGGKGTFLLSTGGQVMVSASGSAMMDFGTATSGPLDVNGTAITFGAGSVGTYRVSAMIIGVLSPNPANNIEFSNAVAAWTGCVTGMNTWDSVWFYKYGSVPSENIYFSLALEGFATLNGTSSSAGVQVTNNFTQDSILINGSQVMIHKVGQ